MELFGMIVVLLFVMVLASDYVRRKKGLDYEEPEKDLSKYEDDRFPYLSPRGEFYWGDPWGDE